LDTRSIGALSARLRRCSWASVVAFGGVTIHVGLRCLFYAWFRLCERHVQVPAHRADLLRIDPPIDHSIAIGADAAKRASGVVGHDAIDHLQGGHLRRAARQAIDAARAAGPLRLHSAFAKEAADFLATDHGRALAVDGLEPLLEPSPHGVLVDPEQTRDLF